METNKTATSNVNGATPAQLKIISQFFTWDSNGYIENDDMRDIITYIVYPYATSSDTGSKKLPDKIELLKPICDNYLNDIIDWDTFCVDAMDVLDGSLVKASSNNPSNNPSSLAGIFAAAVRDYNLIQDADADVLDRHCGLLATFMERIGAYSTISIHNTLMMLMRFYNKHTTDSPERQDVTIKNIEEMLVICHTLAQYGDLIHEWEGVFATISKTIANIENNKDNE